jgi:hypothetical protein
MGGSDPLDRSSRARMRWLGSNRFGSAHDSGGSLAARFTSRGTAAVTGALPPRRRLAGAGSPRLGVALRRTRTSARERGDQGVAHLGPGWVGATRRAVVHDNGRRKRPVLAGDGRRGAPWASWHREKLRNWAVKSRPGLKKPTTLCRRRNSGGPQAYRGGVSGEIGRTATANVG